MKKGVLVIIGVLAFVSMLCIIESVSAVDYSVDVEYDSNIVGDEIKLTKSEFNTLNDDDGEITKKIKVVNKKYKKNKKTLKFFVIGKKDMKKVKKQLKSAKKLHNNNYCIYDENWNLDLLKDYMGEKKFYKLYKSDIIGKFKIKKHTVRYMALGVKHKYTEYHFKVKYTTLKIINKGSVYVNAKIKKAYNVGDELVVKLSYKHPFNGKIKSNDYDVW